MPEAREEQLPEIMLQSIFVSLKNIQENAGQISELSAEETSFRFFGAFEGYFTLGKDSPCFCECVTTRFWRG